jgi:DNA-binding CsgD family transcriptional regulator
MKAREKFLSEADVRALVRLLGEVSVNPGDHVAKKRQLMNGLCALIGADLWIWALGSGLRPGAQPSYSTLLHGGFDAARLARLLVAVDHPDMKTMAEPFLRELTEKKTHLTRARQQIVPVGVIESRPVWNHWEAANIGPILMSYRPIAPDLTSCIALYRDFKRPLFDERETRIAHILLSEIPWLHTQGWTAGVGETVPRLPPRTRTILNLLLEGLSRKEIAAHLAISLHTANDHVKDIYRHFGVSSQAQLVRRFFHGNGQDRP